MPDCGIPKVLLIGGPDVDSRIDLMHRLNADFQVFAAGTSREIEEKFNNAGFSYHRYPSPRGANPFSYLVSLLALIAIVRRERPQIVHTFDTRASILGRLAARVATVPIIIGTITGLGSLYIIQKDLPELRVLPFYERIQKMICRLSDLTIFYTEDDASFFQSKGLAPADKITVLPGSGIAIERFSPDRFSPEQRLKTRKELGLSTSSVVITMVARLVRSKGVLLFAEASRRLQAVTPEGKFLLIGPRDPESLDALTDQEIDETCNTVQWIGPQPEIERYLAVTDIFVLPAGREGIPRVLIEAGAMGLPLITTNLPGCRQVVQDGVNGLLIPPDNVNALMEAILKLSTHKELRDQFGNASREYVRKNFELTAIANRLADIYTSLLTEKRVGL